MATGWDGVTVGAGTLAGKGVAAARDFAAGEVVIAYELVPLTREEFERLPEGEDLFVHSYGGRRWLYPPPARWVNHSDDPSCFQDFERACDVARRPIRAGEAITIDAREETARELTTFIQAYFGARRDGDTGALLDLVDPGAVLWQGGHAVRGHTEVVEALIAEPPPSSPGVEWRVGTGRWEALCSVQGTSDGRHLTVWLEVVAGNWQVLYEHLG